MAATTALTRPPASTPANGVPWTVGDMAKAIGVFLGGTIIVTVPATLLATSLLESGQDIEDNVLALSVALAASLIAQEILLIFAALRFGPWKHGVSLAALGLGAPERWSWTFPVALAVAGLAVVYAYTGVMQVVGIEEDTSGARETYTNMGPLLIVLVGGVLMAPVIEEIFFRGFLFAGLRSRWGFGTGAIVSGLIFALAHLSAYVVIPFAILGVLFAWAYQRTGSIRASIVAHLIINSVTVGLSIATGGSFG